MSVDEQEATERSQQAHDDWLAAVKAGADPAEIRRLNGIWMGSVTTVIASKPIDWSPVLGTKEVQ